jgi:putative sterol carrier protein
MFHFEGHMVTTVQEYFETLPRRFRGEAADGVRAVFQFELSGPGGGTYSVTVDGRSLAVAAAPHASPTVTLKMAAEDYVKLANGKLNGHWAYVTGKMKVAGDMMTAMKMQSLFPPGP